MYGRMYTATEVGVAVTAAQDIIEINAPATACLVIHRIFVGQSSDAADAQAEMLPIEIARVGGTAGSGGTTSTPVPHAVGHAASGVTTVEFNNTTQAGTPVDIFGETFNVQAGFYWVPTPEERIVVPPSGGVLVKIGAPADSLTMSASITFEEID